MGTWHGCTRAAIDYEFEAASGDMRGDVEPVFLLRRADGLEMLAGEMTCEGTTMTVAYKSELDADDVVRVFSVAYLDVFVDHYYRDKVEAIVFIDRANGGERRIAYPA